MIKTSLPCLFAVEKEINEVPYSSLTNMIKAARYNPTIWAVKDLEDIDIKQLGLKGSPTIVSKVWAPPKAKGGTVFEGTSLEKVNELMKILNEKKELFEVKGGV